MAPFDAIGRLVPKRFPNAFFDPASRRVGPDAGAHRRHDPPVGDISQHTVDKRPPSAHFGFDRMDCADLIPENTESIQTLLQYRTPAGKSAVLVQKSLRISIFKGGHSDDIRFG